MDFTYRIKAEVILTLILYFLGCCYIHEISACLCVFEDGSTLVSLCTCLVKLLSHDINDVQLPISERYALRRHYLNKC